MKYFPFKILILCILVPPMLYIVSVQTLEKKLQSIYTQEIEEIYIGDTQPLFEGGIAVHDAIGQNIDAYLRSKKLLSYGVKAFVTVRTKSNAIVYPADFSQREAGPQPPLPMQLAKENYAALNRGFFVTVEIEIVRDAFLSVATLLTYLLLSILIFSFYYRKSARKAAEDAGRTQKKIDHLLHLEQTHQNRLAALNKEKQRLSSQLGDIKERFESEQKKASMTEDEMFEEIVILEKNIEENIALQTEKEDEIRDLKEKIARYEKGEIKTKKQRTKASDSARKRFRTLYKSIEVHDRAVNGFVTLTPDLQLKAEEVMLQLNDDPKRVPIKRKVFGKKNRETVFEVLFSYKGRLYYRISGEQKLEIVSIGTKHTQAKDLTFLDQL